MKKILIFIDWFTPAYKAGGPIVAASNFVHHMQTDAEIFVFTSCRDLGDDTDFLDVVKNEWILEKNGAKIWYASHDKIGLKTISKIINSISPDFIYLHSMYSRYFTIYPLMVSRLKKHGIKVVLAPRGMLRNSALKHKGFKKKLFLNALKASGVGNYIRFHATDQTESKDIQKLFGKHADIITVPDFGIPQEPYFGDKEKISGELRILFVGRVHPIKNLHFLLNALKAVKGIIHLTIAGNIEDQQYWDQCNKLIMALGEGKSVNTVNAPHEELTALFKSHHLMCLPTLGENFGHAIYESLAFGTPVLISDQTMWHDLEDFKAGYDIPLVAEDFVEKLKFFVEMNSEQYSSWSLGAWEYCDNYNKTSNILNNYRILFS